MTSQGPANLPASIHQHLLNLRDRTGEDFNLLLKRFALERLLYRLSKSRYTDQFVLKGALLFATWIQQFHRPTQDLDLLGYGDASAESLRTIFQQLCRTEVEPDGLIFDTEDITVREIREGQAYESQRLQLTAYLGNARIPVQVDIGFGDVVTPAVQIVDYPVLLHFPAPRIRAYPPETVIAEKLQAIVSLGMQNSRMKDFYDLWLMARDLPFAGETLVEAIKATFERRNTEIPDDLPIALSDEFTQQESKAIQWKAFLRRSGLKDAPGTLSATFELLRPFLTPLLYAASRSETYQKSWKYSGPWM